MPDQPRLVEAIRLVIKTIYAYINAEDDEVDLDSLGNAATVLEEALAADSEYTPIIRLHTSEVTMLGGDPQDIDKIADHVADTLMELGYWDVVKLVIKLLKEERDGNF